MLHAGKHMHSVHGSSNTRRIHMDCEEKVQALPGAPQRPVQTQNDAALFASGEVSLHMDACKFTMPDLF